MAATGKITAYKDQKKTIKTQNKRSPSLTNHGNNQVRDYVPRATTFPYFCHLYLFLFYHLLIIQNSSAGANQYNNKKKLLVFYRDHDKIIVNKIMWDIIYIHFASLDFNPFHRVLQLGNCGTKLLLYWTLLQDLGRHWSLQLRALQPDPPISCIVSRCMCCMQQHNCVV